MDEERRLAEQQEQQLRERMEAECSERDHRLEALEQTVESLEREVLEATTSKCKFLPGAPASPRGFSAEQSAFGGRMVPD